MRYLVAGIGGLIVLLGLTFAGVDALASAPVSSFSKYAIGLGLLLVMGGLYVEIGRAASGLEKMLAESERRRLAEKKANEELQAELKLAASQEEKRQKEQAAVQRWNDLRDLDPQRPFDVTQHRASSVARNIRTFAWIILLLGIVGGAFSVANKETEAGVAGIPIGVFVCLLLRGLASIIELLAEACVLLSRLDDRMHRLDDREALKTKIAATTSAQPRKN